MKKLLILGGSRYILPVIEAAHKLGAYVITADYLPDNIAHKYSDHYENISVIEKKKVLEYAQKEQIDGISAFACDAAVVTAAYVADRMGLPSPGPLKSVEILQNKGLFRDFLWENGFRVPFSGTYESFEEAAAEQEKFRLPVIVKPTDSCGSKGVTRVDSWDELREAVEIAVDRSFESKCIVEEFITKKGFSSDCEAFSVNGDLRVMTYNAQWFDSEAVNPYTPAGYSWPSSISPEHQAELTKEIQRLLRLLSMGTSIYNIETRESVDGNAYIMEVSPRGGGNRLAECVRYAAGIDMIENHVRASLGLELIPMPEYRLNGNWMEVILHSQKSGIFKSLQLKDEIRKYVVEEDLWIKAGDHVEVFSGANQTIGTLICNFASQDQANDVQAHVNDFITVSVE